MSAPAWVLVGIGSWVALSLPLALLFAASVDSCRGPVDELPVIPDEQRLPLPPHLREPLLQG